MLRVLVFYGLVVLLGGSAFWYAAAMRRWIGALRDAQLQGMDERQRTAFTGTPRYQKLRAAVRTPMAVTLLLFAALYFVMRSPF